MACTRPIRRSSRTRNSFPKFARSRRKSRSMARGVCVRCRLRRHGDEGRRRQNRGRGGLSHVCRDAGAIFIRCEQIEAGARCTWFYPSASPATVRKQWIAGTLKPAGEIFVDAGAAAALRNGKSLLPAGVTRVAGTFERGDALIVRDRTGTSSPVACPRIRATDAERIRGRQVGRDRSAGRVSRSRRAHPSRRSRAYEAA